MAGDFSIPLLSIDKISRQKVMRGIKDLNSSINHLDLTGIKSSPSNNNSVLFKCTQNIEQHRPYFEP